MCREILNTCVRNTEEAERAAKVGDSGRRSGKGVWGMIEESKLAKLMRLDEEKKVSLRLFTYFAILMASLRLNLMLSFAQDCMSPC
jgi:hypothetical protein